MRFHRALIGLPPSGTVEEAVAFASALLAPGARVRLLEDPSAATGLPYAEVADALAEAEARVAAVKGGLTAAGLRVDEANDVPPDVVVLPEGTPVELVAPLLEADLPVLLLAQPIAPPRVVGVVAWNDPRRVRRAVQLVTEHLDGAALHLVSLRGSFGSDGEALRALLGLDTAPALHALGAGYADALPRLQAFLAETPLDLLATTAAPGFALRPLLELTRGLAPARLLVPGDEPLLEFQRRLELYDVVDRGVPAVVVAAVSVDAAGGAREADDQALVVVSEGQARGGLTLRAGQGELPRPASGAFGVATDPDHVARTLEASARVLSTVGPPIVLVPASLDAARISHWLGLDRRVWAVATEPCSPSAVRAATGVDAVLHAGATLDDGGARDIPSVGRVVSFARVARLLRAVGYPVALAVDAPDGAGLEVVRSDAPPTPEALAALLRAAPPAPATCPDLAGLLALRCGAVPTRAAALLLQAEAHAARTRLVGLVAGARHTVHLQSYIFVDDAVGREVVDALAAAAGRGVTVRVVVDSLWSQHGSLALENPALVRLGDTPGVALRAFRPVAGLTDLKHRNHRKLVIVDGEVALVPGRNVSRSYYTGLDEVVVTPATPQGDVPWLDLTTELTGPVVGELDALFARAWIASGGEPFQPAPPSGPGTIPVWVVAHRGLADGATIDGLRVLIEAARSRVTLANTFPLQDELQHLLLRRLRDGVAVRVITGHVRPRFRGGELPFPGSAERDLMTELVHGRLDPLARAGAQVVAAGLPPRPGWDPALGRVLPHVHTKWVGVDDAWCAVGSVNLDISSAYWESEVMLVVHDPQRVAAFERELDALVATSVPFDPKDPAWQARAAQRAWLAQHWPSTLT